MEKYREILQRCPLFDDILPEELTALLGCLQARTADYEKRQLIAAEGDPAQYIGIVLSGAVQIVQLDYYGNNGIVAELGPGESFGEAFACAELDALPVNIVAGEPSRVLLMDRERILHSCAQACGFHRRLIFNLMKALAQKNIAFHRKMEIISCRTTREKLMTYLLQCAKKADSDRFDIPFDRQELADYLQVDRSGLSVEISRLRRQGVLKNAKNHFELL